MIKVHCLNNISKVGLNALSSDYQLIDEIENADVILVRSANMHEMKLPDSIVAVARAGAGVNNIPYMDLAKKGVVVFNTPGANANAVKELIISAMLMASRNLCGGLNWVNENKSDANINKSVEKIKAQFGGTEIEGKTIGIIGLGAIGFKLASACHALGMNVIGLEKSIDTLNKCKTELPSDIQYVSSLEMLSPLCDFISVNIPFNPNTKDLVNKEAFAQMKDGVILLNFARDGIINEEDLEVALQSGKVKNYYTDFPNSKIVNMDHVVAFPHLGASTEEAEDKCALMAANQIQDYIENGNIRNSVNFPNLDAGKSKSVSRFTVLYEDTEHIAEFMKKITECEHHIDLFSHAERNGLGYAIIDCNESMDQVTIDAIDKLRGVISVRTIKS